MRITQRIAIVAIFALVTACSGGGGSKETPTSQRPTSTSNSSNYSGKTVAVAVKMPASLSTTFNLTSSKTRKPQFTDTNIGGVIALQLCADSGESAPDAGTPAGEFECSSGSVFDIVYNPALYCPNYAPNSTYTCTFQFPAAISVGSQFELDFYDKAPVGGGANGVGGTIPRNTALGHFAVFGSDGGAVTAYDCLGGSGSCLLGAGLSDPTIAVSAAGPSNAININQFEGFIQSSGGLLTNDTYITSVPGSSPNVPVLNNVPVGMATFDSNGQQITGGTCIQDAGNEYANAFTPAANQAPGTRAGSGFDQVTANVSGTGYHNDNGGILSTTTGQPPNRPAALVQAAAQGTANAAAVSSGETYAGSHNVLLAANITPCLVGYLGGPISFAPGGVAVAPINFPNDTISVASDGTNAVPTSGQVGQAGVSPDAGRRVSPYYAYVYGEARNYVGYEFAGGTNCAGGSPGNGSNTGTCRQGSFGATVGTSFSHTLNAFLTTTTEEYTVLFVISPLWGEVGNFAIPSTTQGATFNCAPSSACTTPYASNGARFTQAPGSSPFTTGSYVPIVNMQGSGSSASVYALQEIAPTGGTYSASVPQGNPDVGDPNGGCNGVIGTAAGGNLPATYSPTNTPGNGNPTPLFTEINPFVFLGVPNATFTGGASWPFYAPTSNNPSLACIVTFTDGYNTFQVEFTNTGVTNPQPTPTPPTPTPSPFAPPYSGPTAPSAPTI